MIDSPNPAQFIRQVGKYLPLRTVLVIPFVVQITLAVGLTGYLSYRNSQEAINQLAARLRREISDRSSQHLDLYLSTPRNLSQSLVNGIEDGLFGERDFQQLGRFFWQQVQLYSVGYINYGLVSGDYIGAGYLVNPTNPKEVMIGERSPATGGIYIDYKTDTQGNRLRAIPDPTYNFQEEVWYSETIRAKRPLWSEIYVWQGNDVSNVVAIAASQPIYNQKRQVIGVVGIDLILSDISKFLRQLQIGSGGKILILERNGLLVASAGSEPTFKVVQGIPERLSIFQSSDPLIAGTASYLQARFGNLKQIGQAEQFQFALKDQQVFVEVMPWQDPWGLDWLVLVIMPESDFMEQIHANTRTTVLLCLLALMVAIMLGLATSRWITQPLMGLSQASQEIAQGNYGQQVEVQNFRELRILATVFNQMSQQLQTSHQQLAEYSRSLEAKVRERTQDLEWEIQERLKIEAQITNSLKEKTALLQEVHHRVKNNLQVISSLLRLQSQRVNDPQVKTTLEDSQNRVMAMALVHQNLYQSDDFAQVNLAVYIHSLAAHLFSVFAIERSRIDLQIMVDQQVAIPLDKAVPCGLILNELITNALKHGFQWGRRSGKIIVSISTSPSCLTLQVSNDGEPLPQDFNPESSRSMGLKLVKVLVEQLFATFKAEQEKNTIFILTFNPQHP